MLRHQPLSENSETSANVRATESGDAELDHVDSSSSSNTIPVNVTRDPASSNGQRRNRAAQSGKRGPLFHGNPVFHREVVMRLSVRRLGSANRIAAAVVLGLVLPAYHLLFLWIARESMSPRDVRTVAVVLECFLLCVLASTLTSSALTAEREKQTWNALLLSRLSSAQIVVGKLAGGVVPTLLTLAALWPLNVFLGMRSQMPWTAQLVELICLVSTSLLAGASGLFWSWICRRSQMAQVFTAGGLLVLLMGSILANGLYSAMFDNSYGPMMAFIPHWFNPLTVLISVAADGGRDPWESMAALVFLIFSALGTAVLTAIPTLRLGEGPKEMEH